MHYNHNCYYHYHPYCCYSLLLCAVTPFHSSFTDSNITVIINDGYDNAANAALQLNYIVLHYTFPTILSDK